MLAAAQEGSTRVRFTLNKQLMDVARQIVGSHIFEGRPAKFLKSSAFEILSCRESTKLHCKSTAFTHHAPHWLHTTASLVSDNNSSSRASGCDANPILPISPQNM